MQQLNCISAGKRIVSGVPLSDGKEEGYLWHARGGLPRRVMRPSTIPETDIVGEVGRMRQAVQVVSLVMENSIYQVTERLGTSYAGIFVAFREMLHDPVLLEAMREQIEKHRLDAGSSIATVLESFRKRLSEAQTPVFRERAADLLELQASLLDALDSSENPWDNTDALCPATIRNTNAIAVVETLTPRLVLDLKNTNVRGIACEFAGPTSHAAILCRAFKIPAIAGIQRIHQQLPHDEYAVIDGTSGTIWSAGEGQELSYLTTSNHRPDAVSGVDLSEILLMANLTLSQNAISALAAGAQGIGLYRTEFEFILDNKLLSKQEQFLRYRTVVIAMMGHPVTIRLLDISADKTASVFESFGSRDDPYCRGALFLLSRPEILETQANAIYEASLFGPVRVVYPMVADTKQFLQLKGAFGAAIGSELSGKLSHGAMIELPSAVGDARGILDAADFACLGTNDLIKHLLNVDRDTAIAHGAHIVNAPKLWEAIGQVASAAASFGKELTVCGEMASDLDLLPRFIGLGIRTFSMDVAKIRSLNKRSGRNLC
jgi:phosphoenolpyruvate-protein phosphotransferase (PTS system enzyme I)